MKSTVTNGGDNQFLIERNTGRIKLARPLDYESVTSYNIIVVSTDGGGLKVGPISKNEYGNTLRKSHADGLKIDLSVRMNVAIP